MVESPDKELSDQMAVKFSIPSTSNTSKYTVYKLKIHTKQMQWEVEHRYSAFLELHKTNAGKKQYKQLPNFPEKKFSKMNESVIEKRRQELSNYMNDLTLCFNIFADKDVCKFIGVDSNSFPLIGPIDKSSLKQYFKELFELQERILMLQERFSQSRSQNELVEKSPRKMTPLSSQNERIQGLPEVEKQVYILLDQLETDKDNFSTYIKQYDEFFFQQKQCLSDTMISRLFLGDFYKQKGLVQHAQELEPHSISVLNLLVFIGKILDPRKNPFFEVYKKVFVGIDIKLFTKMNLELNLQIPSCKESILLIAQEYITANRIPISTVVRIYSKLVQFKEHLSLSIYEKWHTYKFNGKKSFASISPMRKKDSSKGSFANFPMDRKQKSTIDFAEMEEPKETEDNFMSLKLIKNKSVAVSKSQVGFQASPTSPQKKSRFFKKEVDELLDADQSSKSSISSTENDLEALKRKISGEGAINLRKITADFTSYSMKQQQEPQEEILKFNIEEVKAEISSRSISEDTTAVIAQFDKELTSKIQVLCKSIQRMYKVQFSMIQADDVLGQIIKYVLLQTSDGKDQLSVFEMGQKLDNYIDSNSDDSLKITLKEELGNHKIVEVAVSGESDYNSYTAVVSNVELSGHVYLACFQIDETDYKVNDKNFFIIFQQVRKDSNVSTQDSSQNASYLHKKSADIPDSTQEDLLPYSKAESKRLNKTLTTKPSQFPSDMQLKTVGSVQIVSRVQHSLLASKVLTLISSMEKSSLLFEDS